MATRNAIDRLTRRIDGRRWGRFTLESLTDDAWLKIGRLAGPRIGPCRQTPGAEHWSTDELISVLVQSSDLMDKPRILDAPETLFTPRHRRN